MGIYLFNVISLPVYRMFIKNKRTFCIVVSVQMFLILAMRDVTLGVDLPVYSRGFNYIKDFSFVELLPRLRFIRAAHLGYPYVFESGYVLLNWVVSRLHLDFHGFLILCAAINMISFGTFLYRYSSKPMLSFTLFASFFTFSYCFGILRQSLAVSIVLWSLPFILKRKKVKAILIILLAFLLHRTAILWIPLIFLPDIRMTKKKYMYMFAGSAVLFITLPFIFEQIVYRILSLMSVGRGNLGIHYNNLIILLLIVLILIYVFIDFRLFDNEVLNLSCWGVWMAFLAEIVGLLNDVLARAVELYFVFLLILIPQLIYHYQNRKVKIVAECVIYYLMVGFLYYSFRGNGLVPYKFY